MFSPQHESARVRIDHPRSQNNPINIKTTIRTTQPATLLTRQTPNIPQNRQNQWKHKTTNHNLQQKPTAMPTQKPTATPLTNQPHTPRLTPVTQRQAFTAPPTPRQHTATAERLKHTRTNSDPRNTPQSPTQRHIHTRYVLTNKELSNYHKHTNTARLKRRQTFDSRTRVECTPIPHFPYTKPVNTQRKFSKIATPRTKFCSKPSPNHTSLLHRHSPQLPTRLTVPTTQQYQPYSTFYAALPIPT